MVSPLQRWQCLKRISQKLYTSLKRPGDFLARYGGEEFVVVLPKTDFKGAELVANQLRQDILALKIPHQLSQTAKYVTISIGVVTTLPNQGKHSPIDLIEGADKMLYVSKKNGRNCVNCLSI